MIIIAPKKNRVSYGGKTFHVTPNGKHYPLGAKKNAFTNCMSDELKGNMITGEKLTKAQKQSNKNKFADAVATCKPKKAGRPKAPAK